ncbi:MAG: 40S ribosomal protein S3A [Amphiamblys sp. WSBS2006]|nr:MAG: 40S ribosomal protein S3A [Amphiamblys sp. WSBS2006]
MAGDKEKKATKGTSKGIRKKGGQKKSKATPFAKKEWYDIETPVMFTERTSLRTLVNKTFGKKTAESGLLGRTIEMNINDIHKVSENAANPFMKIKMKIAEVQGRKCYTRFCGMEMTTDKSRSMVRRWQTLIEGIIDVRTVDGYLLRVFTIGFTRRRPDSVSRTAYIKESAVKKIRKMMFDATAEEFEGGDINRVVESVIAGTIGSRVQYLASFELGILLQNVHVWKVKVLKMPAYENVGMEVDEQAGGFAEGARTHFEEPPMQETV